MSILSKLFGGGSKDSAASSAPAEDYKGFAVRATPIKEGSQFRICAVIAKDGKEHRLIRADLLNSADEAATASVGKAKQMIDEQGDRIFG